MANDELYHFGVKGMKWGKRNVDPSTHSKTPTLEELNKKINSLERENTNKLLRQKMPAEIQFAGHGARAQAAVGVMKFKRTKAIDGSPRLERTDKTPVITDANRQQYTNKITRNAALKYTLGGAASVAVILAGGNLGAKKLNPTDPRMSKNIRDGAMLLAGLQVMTTATTLIGIASAHVDETNDNKRYVLETKRRQLIKLNKLK